jgi:hypothetical protein
VSLLIEFVSYLKTRSEITGLVGTKIYPVRFPQGALTTLPFATYQLIDEPVDMTHDGATLHAARVQVDAYAETYKDTHALADAFFLCLQGFQGSWGAYRIGLVTRERKTDLSEAEMEIHRVSQDFMIRYAEAE